jgi:lipooligosaccharide transport system permease protein
MSANHAVVSTGSTGGGSTGGGSSGSASGRLSPVTGALRQVDYWVTVYQRTWKGSVVTSFASPLFYVLAMGVLLGGFVHVSPARLEGAPSYLAFIVPGLIAAQSMQTAVLETTYPVMGAIKWHKSFYAQLATPLESRDLANAFLGFTLFRVATTSGVYFLVMAPFGVFATWWGPVVAWVATLLVGMGFATWTFAFSAHIRSEASFGLVFRLGLIPLFLFSGSFFPISNLGTLGELVAKLTPLWHGVNLIRMLCLDTVDGPTAAVNTVVLVAVMVAGWYVALRTLARRLEQ